MITGFSKSTCAPVLWAISLGFLSATQTLAHEENFEERVRDYILANPQVILEAMETLSQQQAEMAMVAKLGAYPALFEGPASLGIGAPDAPIRVVEFFDYKCAPCKAIHPHLETLAATYPDLRIEMKHLPILTPGSERASRFALATQLVFGDHAYLEVNDALWAVPGPLNIMGFKRIADDLGYDFAMIEAAMDDPSITAEVDGNRDIAIDLGVLGTPAFVTSNSLTIGETDVEKLAQLWLSQ